MKKYTCALFDMDGVMLDTETQYDKFWKHTGDKYNVGIGNFEKVIKGTTLPGIMSKYFSEHTEEEKNNIVKALDKFESEMIFPEINGSIAFVQKLKDSGIKVGLVTSSTDTKMVGVNRERQFDKFFDTVVTASDVKNGKPHPDCYLLAAKNMEINPEECLVFEDSFAGMEAGNSAGMTVIGVATTHSAKSLEGKCSRTINDFEGLKTADFF